MIPNPIPYNPPPGCDAFFCQACAGDWTAYERALFPSADEALAHHECENGDGQWDEWPRFVEDCSIWLDWMCEMDDEPGCFAVVDRDTPGAIEVWMVS